MQNDSKEEPKLLPRFIDYISLLPDTKLNLEDREQLTRLSEDMRKFAARFNPVTMIGAEERARLISQRLAIKKAMIMIRSTGNPILAMRLLEDDSLIPANDLKVVCGRVSSELGFSIQASSLNEGRLNTSYTISYPFNVMDILPVLERKPSSALKKGRKQAQKQRLAEATGKKPMPRTSGLLNGLIGGLPKTSKGNY